MAKRRSLALLVSVTAFTLFLSAEAFAQSSPQILLEPNKKTVSAGEILSITVSLDTGAGNASNSYIASLEYPKDKLTYESIDADKSPFTMALEAEGGDGKVSIIRGSTKALEGKLIAGTVNFKAKVETGAEVVTVSKDSAIIRSSDNTNILPGSTVQKSNDPANEVSPQVVKSQQSGGIMGIFEWIKNFFSSLFN